jgi:predicted dehydrogenase
MIRVGAIGASPDRGWAASAHLPALQALPQFELAAVCTTRQESADATARKFGIPLAFADWRAMVDRKDIDLVIVTTKVRFHKELVLGALAMGKHVFCEWPLGLDTAEATELLAAAEKAGVRHMVGLQGQVHPTLNRVRELVRKGDIGQVISCSLVSSLASWGPRLPQSEAYRADRAGGATGLTIPGGHSLDTLCHILGPFQDVSAIVTTQHKETEIIGTGQTVPVTSPDQVLVSGILHGGAVASVHIKADMAVPMGVRLEINGTEGDLLIQSQTAPGKDPVGIQRADLVLSRAQRGVPGYTVVEVPAEYNRVPASVPAGPPFYSAQLLVRLADAIQTGTAAAPGFADAVANHRLLDAVQQASDEGRRVTLRP